MKPTPPTPSEDERLAEALRRARLAQAAHFDAVIDIRDAQTLRLKALLDDVAPIVETHRGDDGFIDLVLAAGDPPRLWIDMISYVVMAPDPRTYRLVQDTRDGHETIFETRDRDEMVRKLTAFIANRLIERERLIAGVSSPSPQTAPGHGAGALVLAWLSGFSLGVLALFALAAWLSRSPL